ncbi:tetratricopeptide repeat protein [Sphingomonas donggukensis]|uniref:Tetratricopeptide repeat protein n=1 Tax=Sphingomonas donggukensis TaxID=2949093 RepID=A0ABY4TW01_9SPHN|nr:tetratricopeptide repeat protein [Sphingomonas donggukensis]URW76507.1 tetratricopeptide repeat protein [Sphingomonas donggukensis]
MIAYAAVIAMQIACIVHVIRNRRNQLWIMALFFLPVASAIAYFVVEVLPGMQGNRHVRTVKAAALAKIDPERELRAARDALDLSDTVANRVRVADALADLGRHDEAVAAYREALSRTTIGDAATRAKLARSLFETGDAAAALAMLDDLAPVTGQNETDRRAMLRARIFDHLGREDEALEIYADVVTRLPGEEARCRYAGLLLEQGYEGRARRVLEEVEARMKRLDRQQRAAEADMYAWATRKLAELRAND